MANNRDMVIVSKDQRERILERLENPWCRKLLVGARIYRVDDKDYRVWEYHRDMKTLDRCHNVRPRDWIDNKLLKSKTRILHPFTCLSSKDVATSKKYNPSIGPTSLYHAIACFLWLCSHVADKDRHEFAEKLRFQTAESILRSWKSVSSIKNAAYVNQFKDASGNVSKKIYAEKMRQGTAKPSPLELQTIAENQKMNIYVFVPQGNNTYILADTYNLKDKDYELRDETKFARLLHIPTTGEYFALQKHFEKRKLLPGEKKENAALSILKGANMSLYDRAATVSSSSYKPLIHIQNMSLSNNFTWSNEKPMYEKFKVPTAWNKNKASPSAPSFNTYATHKIKHLKN